LHTVDKTIDVRSNYIDVHEGVQGEANLGDYRKFKACYTVFRESGPSPIRITSIEAGNTGTESFTVIVNPPPSPPLEQVIDKLISTIQNLDDNVPQSLKTSLTAVLKQVSNILSDNNPNNDESAGCGRLGALDLTLLFGSH
jgi:hypothetical protein